MTKTDMIILRTFDYYFKNLDFCKFDDEEKIFTIDKEPSNISKLRAMLQEQEGNLRKDNYLINNNKNDKYLQMGEDLSPNCENMTKSRNFIQTNTSSKYLENLLCKKNAEEKLFNFISDASMYINKMVELNYIFLMDLFKNSIEVDRAMSIMQTLNSTWK